MRNPIYGFLAFLIVEGLVATGFIQQELASEVQIQLEEIIFYLGMALTALLGFHKYIDYHKHHTSKEAEVRKTQPVVENKQPVAEVSQPVFTKTEMPSDSGTPPTTPLQAEQQIDPSSPNFLRNE